MGTDNGKKKNTRINRGRYYCRRLLTIAAATLIIARLVAFSSFWIFPPPEILLYNSFDPSSNENNIPDQCKDIVREVNRCQNEATHTIVLACHRKWCNSFGHCNECAGIGDRFFNYGMNHIQHAYSGDYPGLFSQQNNTTAANMCNLRVELDYPAPGISILKSAIYTDPSGWLGEVFRYRSYMKIRHDLQPQFLPHSSSSIIVGHMTSNYDWHNKATHAALSTKTNWSGCLFHAFFQPNYYLEQSLQYHQKQIYGGTSLRNKDTAYISIHFRVGDALSFKALDIVEDQRFGQNKTLEFAWQQMKQCAKELVNSSPEFSTKKYVKYVLASDSIEVKRLARAEADFYTTDIRPSNFRQNPDRDADAWLELFLLSRQDGLVMNAVADVKGYKGRASYAGAGSAFALLLEKIGFFRKDQVKVCKI